MIVCLQVGNSQHFFWVPFCCWGGTDRTAGTGNRTTGGGGVGSTEPDFCGLRLGGPEAGDLSAVIGLMGVRPEAFMGGRRSPDEPDDEADADGTEAALAAERKEAIGFGVEAGPEVNSAETKGAEEKDVEVDDDDDDDDGEDKGRR